MASFGSKSVKTSYLRPVSVLSGVGPSLAQKLTKLNITRLIDLIFHLPYRYQDRTRVLPIGRLVVGQQVTVEGTIDLTDVIFRGRRALVCQISDGTGSLMLRFFYFSNAQKANLKRGTRIRCFGEVRFGHKGREMIHPEYRLLRDGESAVKATHFTPVYPLTEGVQQRRMRSLVAKALQFVDVNEFVDLIPKPVLQTFDFPTIKDAIYTLHRPSADLDIEQLNEGTHPAQQRLAFEELLANQISLRLLRQRTHRDNAQALIDQSSIVNQFIEGLPFTLTTAQARVINEILSDLALSSPMLRLLQGDVGSGKTVVAAAISLRAIENNAQVAYMAPTELLARQHFESFKQWLKPLQIDVVYLISSMSAKDKRATLSAIAAGSVAVIVGTHALFQEQVEYNNLGLVIIDEQHRFGVQQRLRLKTKGRDNEHPHQLVMTATPIPRTLAMSVYADLDCSILDELPPGRKPINTVAMPEQRRAEVVERIARACAQGQQAYWVCPLVNESEKLECEAAEASAVALQQALPELNVGLIHGQLKAHEKDLAMSQFAAGVIDLLVATTVIEVGVDVPNASLMIIENAERLGLAQLHQLRGRIGRGQNQSACVLLYKPPLKGNARKRLAVIRNSTDGFEIAEQDLHLRGAGEVLGTKQTGRVQMKIADIVRDAELLPLVQQASDLIFADFPNHIEPLVRRWIAQGGRYAGV